MDKVYFQRFVWGKMQDIETSIKVLDGYNKTFFSRKKIKNLDLLNEAALHAHKNNLLYFVTINRDERPFCHMEINKSFYRINFLDNNLRTYLSYVFMGEDNIAEWRKDYGLKLFLEVATYYEFEENSEKIRKNTDYIFKPDGSLHITERDLIKNEQIDKEAQQKIDVSANWEDYPEFGKYEKLIQIERGLKL